MRFAQIGPLRNALSRVPRLLGALRAGPKPAGFLPGSAALPRRAAVLAALGYAAAVLLLLNMAFGAVASLLEKRAAIATADEILGRLQGRRPLSADGTAPAGPPAGSPFLEGPTVTVAGANLMQRVATAVARYDGRIMSSRVELQSSEFGAGFLGVTANFEIGQTEMQKLLYDIEAGMPFLFVDQMVIQGPSGSGASAAAEDSRLKVLLTVYGQWQGTR